MRFKWNDSCETAFQTLKERLITSPVLCYPVRDAVFILDTDASNHGLGCVLSQMINGEEKVIAYASKTLGKGRLNYCTTKKELYAVVHFVQHFRHYLYGQHFIVRTDHASLIWLKNFRNAEGMMARWLATLDTFDFELTHRKGIKHTNADALSRKVTRKCDRVDCPDCEENSIVCPIQPHRDDTELDRPRINHLATSRSSFESYNSMA